MSARVFVIQEPWPNRDTGEPVRDFTPAETYGKLHMLLPCDHAPSEHLADDLLNAGLRHEYRVGDYLVCSGHPAAIGIATAIAAQRGPVNLLVWSGRRRNYNVVKFDLKAVEPALG